MGPSGRDNLLIRISDTLARVRWASSKEQSQRGELASLADAAGTSLDRLSKEIYRTKEESGPTDKHKEVAKAFWDLINEAQEQGEPWPLLEDLGKMIFMVDSRNRLVGAHVVAVVASVNALLPDAFDDDFFVASGESDKARGFDRQVRGLARDVHDACWRDRSQMSVLIPQRKGLPPPLFGTDEDQRQFSIPFFRVAALYHDIGKTLSTEHHVPRGVHIMRDTGDERRLAVEGLFTSVSDKRRFWAILGHHDVFGVLTTGEASLPALADMIGWTSDPETDIESGRSSLAHIAMLSWMNMADSNAAMLADLGGLTTSEACRYLEDWRDVHNTLSPDIASRWPPIGRDEFKQWAFNVSSRPDRTIQRIARLIATSFQYFRKPASVDYETEHTIKRLVEQELQALHGPRIEHFCYRFARFCKLDYGLNFFKEVMRESLEESKVPASNQRAIQGDPPEQQQIEALLRKMVARTCAILHRIVDEYGHLVEGDPRSAPRLGVDMSKLTNPPEAASHICTALKENEAGALRWIIDETSIWLYGD
jgi:hypothetical protein